MIIDETTYARLRVSLCEHMFVPINNTYMECDCGLTVHRPSTPIVIEFQLPSEPQCS